MNPRLLARVWSNGHHGWLAQDDRSYVALEMFAGWFLPEFAHNLVSNAGTVEVDGFEVPALVALYVWVTGSVGR